MKTLSVYFTESLIILTMLFPTEEMFLYIASREFHVLLLLLLLTLFIPMVMIIKRLNVLSRRGEASLVPIMDLWSSLFSFIRGCIKNIIACLLPGFSWCLIIVKRLLILLLRDWYFISLCRLSKNYLNRMAKKC